MWGTPYESQRISAPRAPDAPWPPAVVPGVARHPATRARAERAARVTRIGVDMVRAVRGAVHPTATAAGGVPQEPDAARSRRRGGRLHHQEIRIERIRRIRSPCVGRARTIDSTHATP